MTEALDKELQRIDRIDRVHKYFKSIGSTDEQAATAAAAHADKFVYDGAVLSFRGKAVADADNGVREWFTSNKLDFLLPPPDSSNKDEPTIDPAVLAAAKAGSLTAKGQLFRVVKDRAKVDALIAGKAADDTGADKDRDAQGRFKAASPAEKEAGKNNPWAPDNFNVTRQGQIVKALGMEAAQRIAKAANSHVGATRPTKAA